VRRAAALLGALLALAAAGAPAAVAAPARASLPDIEDEVMCVTCRVPLNIAESPEADRERVFIRSRIARGETKAEIKRALVGQYGARVLATPSDHGVDLVAWLVPGALVLLGLAGVAVVVPRWRRARAASPVPAGAGGPPLDPAETSRLDDELARFDA
jgi:cytochrome c-type biogenesis protein CcmH